MKKILTDLIFFKSFSKWKIVKKFHIIINFFKSKEKKLLIVNILLLCLKLKYDIFELFIKQFQ